MRIYQKYKDKGLEIIGISLDTDREAWLKAVSDDKLPWTQISDLKGIYGDIAKKYSSENRDNDDLISIGIIGLIKAVNTFNTGKGSRLATYAAKCIENELLMMLRGEKKKSREVSLNEPIGMDKEGNTINLLDVVEMDEPGALDAIEKAEDIVRVRQYVEKNLNQREREIINKRYGLNGEAPVTQRKVGEEMGISRSYVSRIEKKALEKLKKALDNSYRM